MKCMKSVSTGIESFIVIQLVDNTARLPPYPVTPWGIGYLGNLLLTWINFNPSMDK